jgi:predicted TIM-barrel fold metal-dependent hydrolase
LDRKHSEVLLQNLYITVSGRYYEAALLYTLEAMGNTHVLFASDHPYEIMQEGVDFIKNAKISNEVRAQIFSTMHNYSFPA